MKMKKRMLALAAVLLLLPAFALAEKARFLIRDGNSGYHASHLQAHVGSQNCRLSGNYITVRSGRGSGSTLGHAEQADSFRLEEISGNFARITVTYRAPTSPDSRVGLSGWVNADYVECPCSQSEYYGVPRTTYSLGTVTASGAQLRELASSGSRPLVKVPGREAVEVLADYDGGWYRVRWAGRTGFLRTSEVTVTAAGIPESGGSVIPPSGGGSVTPSGSGWRDGMRRFLEANHSILGSAALYDIDRDGTPELITHNGEASMAAAACLVYAWDGTELDYLGEAGFRDCVMTYYPGSAYPGLFCSDGNMGSYTTRYYARVGNSIVSQDVLEEDHTHGGSVTWADDPWIVPMTLDDALFSLVRGTAPQTLRMYSYQEIVNMGWSSFLAW